MQRVSKVGRPKAENPLPGKELNRRYEQRLRAAGCRKVPFWMDASAVALFETMRTDAGFTARENSEFLAALLLKAAGKPWFGQPFTLPALDLLRPILAATARVPRPPLR